VIGGSSVLSYTAANIQSAINGIAGFAGAVTVSGVTATGFTITYGGASADSMCRTSVSRQPELRRLLCLG
jgi:hypothetical protein